MKTAEKKPETKSLADRTKEFSKMMLVFYQHRAKTTELQKELAASERKQAEAMKKYHASLADIDRYFSEGGEIPK